MILPISIIFVLRVSWPGDGSDRELRQTVKRPGNRGAGNELEESFRRRETLQSHFSCATTSTHFSTRRPYGSTRFGRSHPWLRKWPAISIFTARRSLTTLRARRAF